MSCKKCGNSNTNCGCKDTAYTTVKTYTCPPDAACPAPLKCAEFFDAACVYMTDGIADAGIQPGSSLESIIQQLIILVTNPGCADAPGGVPGGGTVNFVDAIWPGNAIIIDGGPIQNSGTFIFNGQGTSLQYIDGQGNLQTFPSIPQPIEFQTNGTPNSVQDLLNLVAGTGITLTESNGSVTIDVDAVTYSVQNGLSEQPLDSGVFELGAPTSPGAPLLHDTYIAGSQYAFEINNTASMFLQGNRVDIEGADPGVKVLSTGGTSDNSLEVTGTQVALESVGTGATRIFLDPAKIRIQTPLYNLKNNNDVLTLIDKTTGEVEFAPVSSILLQTDGTDNTDQNLLNLVSGNGITLTNSGGDVTIDGPTFQTNSTDNSTQTLLNLVAGTGITLNESGGSVTIQAQAPAINLTTNNTGGGADYDPVTGDLNIPIYQTQLEIQDEGTFVLGNPTVINFIGAGVTATNPLGTSTINVTIPGGGGGGGVAANNGLILAVGDTVQLGGPDTAPAPLIRETYITTTDAFNEWDFDISGTRATKPILRVFNAGQGSALKGESTLGYGVYGVTVSGFAGYFQSDTALISLYSVSQTGKLAGEFESVSAVNNTTIPVLRIMRTVNTSDPAVNGADGIGAAVDFFMEDDNNIAVEAGSLSYAFTDATTTAVVSQFSLSTADAGTVSTKLEVTGLGQLILNEYTTGTAFSGSPYSGPAVGVLKVDAAGHVFVGPAGGGGGGTYDSNTGIFNNSDVFQLGSIDLLTAETIPLYEDRYISTIASKLSFNGGPQQDSRTTDYGSILEVVLDDTSAAYAAGIKINTLAAPDKSIALNIKAANEGLWIESNGEAIKASFPETGIVFETVNDYPAYVNQVLNNTAIVRSLNGTAVLSAGYGTALSFSLNDNPDIGTVLTIGASISYYYTNITSGNETGNMDFNIHMNNGGIPGPSPALRLKGEDREGQVQLPKYALGVIYRSATTLSGAGGYNLGIDANGNVWATDFSTGGGGGGVDSVSGNPANGFTVTVTNPTTTPTVTVGTSISGVLVGNGTGVSAVTGNGVMVFSGTGYTFQTLPTVNDGQLLLAANTGGATNTGVVLNYTAPGGTSTGPFTANKSTNSTLQLSIGPAITNLVSTMAATMPTDPAVTPGGVTALPAYIVKSSIDNYALATPVTTFSTGTTGFLLSSAASSATSSAINGAVVLSGVLNVANGGTGTSTAPTAGQILIGNSSGGFSVASITYSGGTTVTVGDGTINIGSSLGGVTAKNGTYVAPDGSVRLGTGPNDPISGAPLYPQSALIEETIIRMNAFKFRLSDGLDQIVNNLGFDIDDSATVKRAYLGTPTRGFWFSAGSTAGALAPTAAFEGFIHGGQTTNAFPTDLNGFLFRSTGAATFPASFSGVAVDTGGSRVITGYLGSNVYEIISKSGNTITQYGQWGGTVAGNIPNFLMYQANATSKLISIGDVSLLGNSTRFQIDDANIRYRFSKGPIYAGEYGTSTPVPIDNGSIAKYILGTASNGKFYEIPAISIGGITVGGTTWSPTTIATTGSANPLTVTGAGTVSVSLSGSTLQITGTSSSFPYWSTLSLTTNGGSVSGATSISPDVNGPNTLNLVAGNNITFTAVDSTTNKLEIAAAPTPYSWGNITFTGNSTPVGAILQPDAVLDGLSIGAGAGIGITVNGGGAGTTADSFTITNSGVLSLVTGTTDTFSITGTSTRTLNIPYGFKQIQVTNNNTVDSGTSNVNASTWGDNFVLNGGPGISLTTNTGSRRVTISSTAAAMPSSNGVWQYPNATAPTEYRLGSDDDGSSTFTADRFIDAQGKFLKIKGTPAAGAANAILKLSSSTAGRGLRVENILAGSNGAIYATSISDATPDSTPNGTIYAESTGKGHAIAAVSDPTDTSALSAVFGKGRQGVKGYTEVANGVGVFGESVTGLGIGVQGKAVGNDPTSYGGVFSTSNTTPTKQEIVKIAKSASGVGEGATIGYYATNKIGEIGYRTIGATNTSQYEATVYAGGTPSVRHRIYSTGQHNFSAYADSASFPLPVAVGTQYKGITLTANTAATGSDVGNIYTSRIEYGIYSSALALTGAPAGTLSANATAYSLNGKYATIALSGTITYSTLQGIGTKTLTFSLPSGVNYSSTANASFTWNTFRSMAYFSKASFAVGSTSVTVTLTIDNAMPANFVNEFYINLTYLTA